MEAAAASHHVIWADNPSNCFFLPTKSGRRSNHDVHIDAVDICAVEIPGRQSRLRLMFTGIESTRLAFFCDS